MASVVTDVSDYRLVWNKEVRQTTRSLEIVKRYSLLRYTHVNTVTHLSLIHILNTISPYRFKNGFIDQEFEASINRLIRLAYSEAP